MKNFGKKTKVITSQFFNIVTATDAIISPIGKIITSISTLPSYIDIWVQRASHRRQLSILDDRLLNDIGLTRAEADMEARKPFWKV